MAAEQWHKWKPIEGLAKEYYIESIVDTIDGLKIVLFDAQDKKRKLFIIFHNSVDSYKRTDESFTGKTIYTLYQNYGKQFYKDWTFFKVENSEYLQWLSEQSDGFSTYRGLVHFVILAMDSMLDIVVDYEPEVKHSYERDAIK